MRHEAIFRKVNVNPDWEAKYLSNRPLRGVQGEIIKRVEQFIAEKKGGVMTILSSRQTGKNETAANLQRRHLWRNQFARYRSIWIRTAPTHVPQIVNSKKRLEDLLQIQKDGTIGHPIFGGQRLKRTEGYIWSVGNASVEFMSSGPQSNVVGATASECLDMDEAHKVSREKFDEDFAPFTASTNAGTLLWGVAADGRDTLESYRQNNLEQGKEHLNLFYPCEIWAELNDAFRGHLESRVAALGWEHPIIKTQYRLVPVSAEGRYLTDAHIRALFDSEHERQLQPRPNTYYEMVIDVAGGNEDFNPDNILEGNEDTATDSTVVWIYEVSQVVCSNGLFPVIRLVNLKWMTGVDLPIQETEIKELIKYWKPGRVTIDGIGIGRQLAESLENTFGVHMINKYLASSASVSEDLFDLQARLNFSAVQMFKNDGSPEWAEFERQAGWTKYQSNEGRMKLVKPGQDRHIDMVKSLTYINQNRPQAGMHEIYSNEGDYSV